jgi:hypothetical protein
VAHLKRPNGPRASPLSSWEKHQVLALAFWQDLCANLSVGEY